MLGSCVTLGVTLTIVGAVLSRTVITAVSVSVLPKLLVAEQVTRVAPSGNTEPDAGAQVTGSVPSCGSVADAVKATTAPDGPVASTLMFFGAVTFGGFGFLTNGETVTANVADAALSRVSADVAAHRCRADGKLLPDTGVQVTGRAPSTRLTAETAKVTGAPATESPAS